MTLSVRVVTVPERLGRAMALAEPLGAWVLLDEDRDGVFTNHRRALESATGSHVVVLEDDAIVCPDFLAHVARLVQERPVDLIGLYMGRSHPQRIQPVLADLAGTVGWVDDDRVRDRLRWGVGYVMPTADIPHVLEHLEAGDQHPWLNADVRIGSWHALQGRLSYPLPSPVDHDDSLPSTTGQTRGERRAWSHCRNL